MNIIFDLFGDFMNKELILELLSALLIVVLIIFIEEAICFFIIKKQDRYDEYKEYKAKKALYTYSLYLYKDKRYLPIKAVVIAIALLLAFTTTDKKEYYDALGNSYKNATSVIFYDKSGNKYTIDKDTHYFIDSNDKITEKNYVDINGYVVDENDLYYSDMSGISYSLDGEIYFNSYGVYWDKEKRLHYYDAQNDIIVSDYNFTANTKTGDCSFEKKQ